MGKSVSPTRRLTALYPRAQHGCLAGSARLDRQTTLQQQSSDTLVVNIAGRQRMLSQRLSKAALTLEVFSAAPARVQNALELRDVVTLWQHSQEGLPYGDPTLGLPGNNRLIVRQLFVAIEPEYRSMLRASGELLALPYTILRRPVKLTNWLLTSRKRSAILTPFQ